MWILKGSKDGILYLLPGTYVVGRKNCDLVLDGDQSISRKHAVIEVSHQTSNWSNPDKIPEIQVFDAGSKYGTTLISGKISTTMQKDAKHKLKDGDVIHFGLQWNKWTLGREPLVVVVSALPKAERSAVKTVVGELGGHVVSNWLPQTSHLTMASITMTVKAISALAYAKPIVTPQYWTAYKKALVSKTQLPDSEDFIPPLGETVLNKHEVSFLANPERRHLFKEKIFYFFSEPQFKDHGCLVVAAGGEGKLVSGSVRQKKQFLQPNAVVMQLLSLNSQSLSLSQTPEVYSEVADCLKEHGKRLIPSSEIGLAVLHCSVKKYCNPNFNFASLLVRSPSDPQPSSQDEILATETQDAGPSQLSVGERKVIPDSGSDTKSSLSLTSGSSRSSVGARGSQIVQSLSQEYEPDSQLDNKTVSSSLLQSQSQSQSQWPLTGNTSARASKRLRAIEESDDEVELLSPCKLPVRPVASQKEPEVVCLEDDDDMDSDIGLAIASAVSVKLETSKLDISKFSSHDSDEADALFDGFKESKLHHSTSLSMRRAAPASVEPEDLFEDFMQEEKPAVEKPLQSQQKTIQSFFSESKKRSLSPGDGADGSQPPEKRPARPGGSGRAEMSPAALPSTSRKAANASFVDEDAEPVAQPAESQIMSAVKKEDSSLDKTCNVTVLFKSLVVSKRKDMSISSASTTLESTNVMNYKKFKKVSSATGSILPRIIGGSDLRRFGGFVRDVAARNGRRAENDEQEEEDGLWAAVTQTNGSRANRSRKL